MQIKACRTCSVAPAVGCFGARRAVSLLFSLQWQGESTALQSGIALFRRCSYHRGARNISERAEAHAVAHRDGHAVAGQRGCLRIGRRGKRQGFEPEAAELAVGFDDAQRPRDLGVGAKLNPRAVETRLASAIVAPTFAFCGYSSAACRALPEKKITRSVLVLSLALSSSRSCAGVPFQACGPFKDV